MDHVLRCLTATWHAVKQHACAGHKGTSLVGFGKGTASPADLAVWSDQIGIAHMLVVEPHGVAHQIHALVTQQVRRLQLRRDMGAQRRDKERE